jgi:hypothetical protein
MKTLIKFIVILLTITIFNNNLFSQEITGFNFFATDYLMSSEDYEESYKTDEMFIFSLKDGFLVHNMFDLDGKLIGSQFYKITKYEFGENQYENFISITVESGLTGIKYNYTLHVSDDYILLSYEFGSYLFVGVLTGNTSYKQ